MLKAMSSSADLIREARRRAGLTQRELAQRCGTTQSAIARLESGGSEPSLARVRRIVAATGAALQIELVPTASDPEGAAVLRNLSLTIDERWDKAVNTGRFVVEGRRAPSDEI